MPDALLPRRAACCLGAAALGLLLAGCGDRPEAPRFEPLRYDYLTRIKLNVGRVDIDDSWTPRGADRHVEFRAPTPPLDALHHMAEDRLVPGGGSGRALFTIDDASIIQASGSYRAILAVHLDLLNDDGDRLRGIDAHATATHAVTDDDPDAVRSDLNELTRQVMNDMNVDFEYQIRNTLRGDLQTTSPTAPPPAAVDTQDLDTPAQQNQAPAAIAPP
jgi:hypothetical protein